ncbi:MAG: phosphoenolpyruvate synthase [Bacteroidota bacterium]|nr:phosphoenolpyruvate synthase [Bacteroidota bacterium]
MPNFLYSAQPLLAALHRYSTRFFGFPILLLVVLSSFHAKGQDFDAAQIKAMIARYKTDSRGPYKDIRWFCKDGTIREARDPCGGAKSGYQHARYKDEVASLAEKKHIFLGQILAGTPNDEFWDQSNAQSRLKQYQLDRYLRNTDNGWVNQRGQYYRGAMQDEDESEWGIEFYDWLLSDPKRVGSYYFLIRQSLRDIPHASEDNTIQLVRAISEELAEAFPSFQELRIKIHGMPDSGDSGRVWDFQDKNKASINEPMARKFDQLVCGLEKMFKPFQVSDFSGYVKVLPKESPATIAMENFLAKYPTMDCPPDQCRLISETSLVLRQEITQPLKSSARLALLEISNKMEGLLNKEYTNWEVDFLSDLMEQVNCLAEASAAFGYLELWEWNEVSHLLAKPIVGDTITLQQLSDFSEAGRRVAEWSTGMIRSQYMPVIDQYRDFEPLASGFYDDRVRSSVLLYLGSTVSRLGDEFANKAGLANDVLGIKGQSSIHGLNPGFTVGELVVVKESPDNVDISPDKIYVFNNPPSNLKPVAGIATVTEGNMVSHIQLLARNLGIPNAVLSRENMDEIYSFHGKEVFYAVSNKGTVIMKLASKMEPAERKLFEEKRRKEEKISVPVGKLQLDNPHIVNMDTINASHSGKICGPKAANLGQLRKMFPDHVVKGLVLPFALFRQHMNQTIPGTETNYWAKMIGIFDHAECMRCSDATEPEIEKYILRQLDTLRTEIKKMPMLPSFRTEMQQQFQSVFGQPLGKVPVFVRSDTNMEDLKDFTGAGLNLTVFNVVEPEKIFQGIRDVWASPYSERSYRWRQHYLNDPENVFPSIVIIPSVDGDYSGVMITKGITTGEDTDLTVAFNRGVGGAVDGQAAESWVLRKNGVEELISPARETTYLTIPVTGGSIKKQTTFENRILSSQNLESLRAMASDILTELPKAPGISTKGPFDIELGFKDDKIWLFQVRPFVENKAAAASEYLQKITPTFDGTRILIL